MKWALILVDVIRDFFHPEGVNYHPEYENVLMSIRRVLAIARQAGWTIIHVRETHPIHHDQDFEFEKLPVHCLEGSAAVEWADGIEVLPGEHVLQKRRYSAFFETDLNLLLREKAIDQVVVVGVKTNVCVRATVQDAFGWGYRPVVIREAVGSNYVHLHEASLEDINRYMGIVQSLDQFERWALSLEGEVHREV